MRTLMPWLVVAVVIAAGAWFLLGVEQGTDPDAPAIDGMLDDATDDLSSVGLVGRGHDADLLQGDEASGPTTPYRVRVLDPDGEPAAGQVVQAVRKGIAFSQDALRRGAWQSWHAGSIARDAKAIHDPSATSRTEAPFATATSDDEGWAEFALAKGHTYEVVAQVEAPLVSPTGHLSMGDTMNPTEMTLRLQTGHALRGRVLDSADQPVGAVLAFQRKPPSSSAIEPDAWQWSSGHVKSNATDGAFAVPAAPHVPLVATVTLPGRARVSGIEVPFPRPAELVLRVPALSSTLVARVHDAEGQPVEGAVVLVGLKATLEGQERPIQVTARSDARGNARCAAPPGPVVSVRATAPGFLNHTSTPPLARWSGASVPEEGDAQIAITLKRGGRVEGTVTAAEGGAPLPDANVAVLVTNQLQGQHGPLHRLESTTDDAGRYAIDGVPVGMHVLVAAHPQHHLPAIVKALQMQAPPPELSVIMPPGRTTIVRDLVLTRGVDVEGRVIDDAGSPVADATVISDLNLGSFGWRWGVGVRANLFERSIRSDAEGHFATSLPAGRPTKLGARREGLCCPWSEPITLEAGQTPPTVVIKMERGGTVRGLTLQASEGSEPTPLPGVRVFAWSNATRTYVHAHRNVQSDAEGRFEVTGLAPGAGQLNANAPGRGHQRVSFEALKPGEVREGVEVVFGATETLTGTLLDAEGEPAARMPIMLQAMGGMQQGSGQTDEHGRFELVGAARGTFDVRVLVEGTWVSTSPRVELPSDDVRLTMGAVPKRFAIEGRIVDPEGAPVPVCTLQVGRSARPNLPAGFVGPGRHAGGSTIVGGRFRVLATGEPPITLRVRAPRDATGRPLPLQDLTRSLSEDELEGPIELRLERGALIEGHVLGPQSVPIEGVTVMGAVSGAPHRTQTDATGHFAFSGLAPGTEMKLSTAAYEDYMPATGLSANAGDPALTIRVERGLAISGTVRRADGEALGNVNVNATFKLADGTSQHRFGRVDARGAFRVRGIPPTASVQLGVQSWGGPGRGGVAPLRLENVRAGTTGLDLVLHTGATIKGAVVDADGEPVANAHVHARPKDPTAGANMGFAQTDAKGTFEVGGLKPGVYNVTARVGNTPSAQSPQREISAPATGVRLTLPRTTSVSGTIEGLPSDAIGPNHWRASLTEVGTKQRMGHGVQIAADGRFVLEGLPEGKRYTMHLVHQSGAYYAESAPFASGAQDLVLQAKRSLSISGRALRPSGEAKERLWVRATSAGGPSSVAQVQDDGTFELRGLPPGEYQLHAQDRSGQRTVSGNTEVAAGATDVELHLAAR